MLLQGVTQAGLAASIDLTQPYISAIVNGRYRRLPVETTRRFADFFGCQIEDLFPPRVLAREGDRAPVAS